MESINPLLDRLRPRLTKFIPESHKPTPKQTAFLILPQREALYGGAAGGGKGLEPDALVLTPWGWKPIKDLSVGSKICATDGTVTHVINKWNRGVQQKYRLTWHNGTSTICDSDHIWLGWVSGKRSKQKNKSVFGLDSARKWTTQEIFECEENSMTKRNHRFSIPSISEPVIFNVHGENRGSKLHISRSIPSYVVGVILGDGWCNTSTAFCSNDQQIVDEVSSELNRKCISRKSSEHKDCKSYTIGECNQLFKHLGLKGKRSWEKFIPRIYKFGSVNERWSLLQGLMDTDGWVEEDGDCYYTSTSKQLRDDVSEVAKSLGAITFHRQGLKHYTHKGKRKKGRLAYTVRIKINDAKRLFRLDRKKELVKNDPQSMSLHLEKIEKIDCGKTVCIQIAHRNSLFITEDYVVTHNSDCLLMSALQYIDVPGYSALLMRKTLADLKQPGALLDRAQEWLSPWIKSKEVKYIASQHTYEFKTYDHTGRISVPSKLVFGYLGQQGSRDRYQGAEFAFSGFDELTQHTERNYTYLLSRLRKNCCYIHLEKDKEGYPIYVDGCPVCKQMQMIPIKLRSASNPGNIGAAWVQKRFSIKPTPETAHLEHPKYVGVNVDRPFIPSFLTDNPYINQGEYLAGLGDMTDEDRAQLQYGDWGFNAFSKFKKKDVRRYSRGSDYIYLGEMHRGRPININPENPKNHILKIFQTIDPASSILEGPGDTELMEGRVKNPSWSVISTWLLTKCYNLIWLNMARVREEIPEVMDLMRKQYQEWRPSECVTESNGLGRGVTQYARRFGLPVVDLVKDKDKVIFATTAIMQMKAGRIWLPQEADWLEDAEEEVFNWQGHPSETDDIVDTLSMAANHVSWENVGENSDEYFQPPRILSEHDIPDVIQGFSDGYGIIFPY